MRRARHGDVPGFRHPSDGGTACAQCPDIAGAAQFKIRGGGSAGGENATLKAYHSAARPSPTSSKGSFLLLSPIAASTLIGPPPAVTRYRQPKQNRSPAVPPLL